MIKGIKTALQIEIKLIEPIEPLFIVYNLNWADWAECLNPNHSAASRSLRPSRSAELKWGWLPLVRSACPNSWTSQLPSLALSYEFRLDSFNVLLSGWSIWQNSRDRKIAMWNKELVRFYLLSFHTEYTEYGKAEKKLVKTSCWRRDRWKHFFNAF